MRIGIIGGGVVGHATARCYMEHADVRVYDKVRTRRTHTLRQTLASDLVFVCLPEKLVPCFFKQNRKSVFALRSTVPVGTCRRLRSKHGLQLVHHPEFLTARKAVVDAMTPTRLVIGSVCLGLDDDAHCTLCSLLSKRFPGVEKYGMLYEASELAKLATNAFFATKLAFFNELYTYCNEQCINWNAVLGVLMTDGRIAHSHTQVPGHDGKRGFGGACLPKDLDQYIECVGDDAVVAKAARARNKKDRVR